METLFSDASAAKLQELYDGFLHFVASLISHLPSMDDILQGLIGSLYLREIYQGFLDVCSAVIHTVISILYGILYGIVGILLLLLLLLIIRKLPGWTRCVCDRYHNRRVRYLPLHQDDVEREHEEGAGRDIVDSSRHASPYYHQHRAQHSRPAAPQLSPHPNHVTLQDLKRPRTTLSEPAAPPTVSRPAHTPSYAPTTPAPAPTPTPPPSSKLDIDDVIGDTTDHPEIGEELRIRAFACLNKARALPKGAEKDQQYREANVLQAQASVLIFAANNKDPLASPIDLHGLHLPEALEKSAEIIRSTIFTERYEVVLVVGKGKHSRDGNSCLGPGIIEWGRMCGLGAEYDPNNSGRVVLSCDAMAYPDIKESI